MDSFHSKGLIKCIVAALLIIGCTFFLTYCTDKTSSVDIDDELDPLRYEIITDDLEIPWQMDFTPDGRIFITERNGLVKIIENDQLSDQVWLDLRDSLQTSYGTTVTNSGLLGIALDPDFSSNRYVYIGYSYEAPGEDYDFNKLVRYRDNPVSGKGEFEAILLDKVKGESMHNTGRIKFGPDNKLYWAVGDRHEVESAQDLDDLSGSLLRINPDGSIPEDNPFSGSYIYAYGLRNTQGFDWHPDTNVLLATDHGPSGPQGCCHDEINVIEPGKNYGWPDIRGEEEAEGMETPLLHSDVGSPRDEYTWAPSGAAFLHSGPWDRSFLFSGLRSQSLWRITFKDDELVSDFELTQYMQGEFGRVRAVEQDLSGSIYIMTSNLDQHDVPFDKDYLVRITVEE